MAYTVDNNTIKAFQYMLMTSLGKMMGEEEDVPEAIPVTVVDGCGCIDKYPDRDNDCKKVSELLNDGLIFDQSFGRETLRLQSSYNREIAYQTKVLESIKRNTGGYQVRKNNEHLAKRISELLTSDSNIFDLLNRDPNRKVPVPTGGGGKGGKGKDGKNKGSGKGSDRTIPGSGKGSDRTIPVPTSGDNKDEQSKNQRHNKNVPDAKPKARSKIGGAISKLLAGASAIVGAGAIFGESSNKNKKPKIDDSLDVKDARPMTRSERARAMPRDSRGRFMRRDSNGNFIPLDDDLDIPTATTKSKEQPKSARVQTPAGIISDSDPNENFRTVEANPSEKGKIPESKRVTTPANTKSLDSAPEKESVERDQTEESKPKQKRENTEQKTRESKPKSDIEQKTRESKPKSDIEQSEPKRTKPRKIPNLDTVEDVAEKGLLSKAKNLIPNGKVGGLLGLLTAIPALIEVNDIIKSDDSKQEKGAAIGEIGGSTIGGIGGAAAGGKAGAVVGGSIGSIFGGVGAVPGALIGGILGSIVGGISGSTIGAEIGKNVGEYATTDHSIPNLPPLVASQETISETVANNSEKSSEKSLETNNQIAKSSDKTETNNQIAKYSDTKIVERDTRDEQTEARYRELKAMVEANHRALIPGLSSAPTSVDFQTVEAKESLSSKPAPLGHSGFQKVDFRNVLTPQQNQNKPSEDNIFVTVGNKQIPLRESPALKIPSIENIAKTESVKLPGTAPKGLNELDQKSAEQETFLEALKVRESGGDYQATNGNYHGAYQLGNIAFKDTGYMDSKGNWTGKDDINSLQDYIKSPSAQDKSVQELMKKNWHYLNSRPLKEEGDKKVYAKDLIGQKINGVTITESGLLAGAHLGGAKSVRQMLSSDGKIMPVDGNNVPIINYMQSMGGKDVSQVTMSPSLVTGLIGSFEPEKDVSYVRAGSGRELTFDNIVPRGNAELVYHESQYKNDAARYVNKKQDEKSATATIPSLTNQSVVYNEAFNENVQSYINQSLPALVAQAPKVSVPSFDGPNINVQNNQHYRSIGKTKASFAPSLYSKNVKSLGDEGFSSIDVRPAYVADYKKPQDVKRDEVQPTASGIDIAKLGATIKESIVERTEHKTVVATARENVPPLTFSNVPVHINDDLGMVLINSNMI